MKKSIQKSLSALLLGTAAVVAHAEWPDDKPIEVVVGFAPGGETDIMARGLAPFITKHLGQRGNLVVVNKIGASGEIANAYVQRAKPDGYTIGVVNVPPLVFLPLTKKTQYDPKEFALVARVVSDPTFLVTRADSPFKSLKKVVEALKQKPGSLSFGYNGVGTNGHLAMLQLQNATGVELNDVPFNGSGQSKTALLGGHTQLMFTSLTAVPTPESEPVPLHIVSQFMEVRAPALKNVATAREEGINVVMPSDRDGVKAPLERGDVLEYSLTDEATGSRSAVQYTLDRVTGDEMSFNAGTRIERVDGSVVTVRSPVGGLFESAMPAGGWVRPDVQQGQMWRATSKVYTLTARASGESTFNVSGEALRVVTIRYEGWQSNVVLNNASSQRISPVTFVVLYAPELRRVVQFKAETTVFGGTAKETLALQRIYRN